LAARWPVVIVNTNPLHSDRARYDDKAREAGFRFVAYFFQSTHRTQQSAWRKTKVPIPAIAGMLRKTRVPVLEEGGF
jgi:hypothetical protein